MGKVQAFHIESIYSDLEARRYDSARKSIQKLKKKFPDSFLKLEILELLAEVFKESEGDRTDVLKRISDIKPDSVGLDVEDLKNLALIWKHNVQFKEMAEFLQDFKVNGDTIETQISILELKFFAFAIVRNFQQQAATAMQLYKVTEEPKYLIWAQVSNAFGPNSLMKTLALKMIERTIKSSDNLSKSEDLLRFFIRFYQNEGKYAEAIEFTKSKYCKSLDPLLMDRKSMLAEAYFLNENFVEANALYTFMLNQDQDEWTWWNNLFESISRINNPPETITIEYDEKPWQLSVTQRKDLHQFILSFKDEKSRSRGIYLAELEYAKRFETEQVQSLTLSYIEKFGSKPICFDDVAPYLTKELTEKLHINIERPIQSISDACHLATYNRIYTLYNKHVDINDLYAAYTETLKFGKDLEKTENQFGDPLIEVIVFNLMKESHISESIILLEDCLTRSPHNYIFKFMLVQLYNRIGCYDRSQELFFSCDIKNIQFETVTYLLSYDLFDNGKFKLLNNFLQKFKNFRNHIASNSSEILRYGFENEAYSKIEEFIHFQDRLSRSLTGSIYQLNSSLLFNLSFFESCEDLVQKIQPVENKEPIINDDLDVIRHISDSEKWYLPRECQETEDKRIQNFHFQRLLVDVVRINAEIGIFLKENKAFLKKQKRKKKKASSDGDSAMEPKKKKLQEHLIEIKKDIEKRKDSFLLTILDITDRMLNGGDLSKTIEIDLSHEILGFELFKIKAIILLLNIWEQKFDKDTLKLFAVAIVKEFDRITPLRLNNLDWKQNDGLQTLPSNFTSADDAIKCIDTQNYRLFLSVDDQECEFVDYSINGGSYIFISKEGKSIIKSKWEQWKCLGAIKGKESIAKPYETYKYPSDVELIAPGAHLPQSELLLRSISEVNVSIIENCQQQRRFGFTSLKKEMSLYEKEMQILKRRYKL